MVMNVTSLTIVDLLPAVILMWFLYLTFSLGYKMSKHGNRFGDRNKAGGKYSWLILRKRSVLFFIALLSIVSSFISAYYYTGQTPLSTIQGLISGNRSLYYEYQIYAKIQQRGVFSLSKLPYIFMMFYFKFILFYSCISFLIIKHKINKFDILFLSMVTFSHIYFGIARGTNYEFFELLVLILFVVLTRTSKNVQLKKVTRKYIRIILLGIIMVFLFYNRIKDRGVIFDFSVHRDYTYDFNNIVSTMFPGLSFGILLIYDYFGFGFYYMSKYITDIWFSSIGSFFIGIIPYGYNAAFNSTLQSIILEYVELGTRWHPDTAIIINNFGFLGLLIICFVLGKTTKIVKSSYNDSLSYLTQFIIFLQMISLPIGNFVFVSSASTLIVVLLVFLWCLRAFVNRKKYYGKSMRIKF